MRRSAVVLALVGGLLAGCSGGGSDTPAASGPPLSASNVEVTVPGPAPLPTARTEVAGAAWEGRIVVVGGLTEAGVASDRVDVYDPVTNRWDEGPRLPIGLHHVGLAAFGDRVYLADGRPCVAGGEEPRGTIASVECLYDTLWQRVASLQVPRHGLAVVGIEGRVHVIGGGPRPGLFVSTAHEVVDIP
ncbi:MAG TPA: kelch repeat-containing protein [Acidimicrobiia bacterium]